MRSSKWPRFVEELDEEIGHSNDWSIYQEARSHYEAAMREYSWWSYYQKYGMLYPNTSSPLYPYLPRPQHSSMLNQPLRQSNHRLVWCIPVRSQPTFYADSTAPLSHHLNLQEAQNRAPWQARQALSRASMQAREALSRASMQARVARSRAALLTHEARSRASMQALFESLMCDPSRLAECQKELGNAQFKMKQYGKALPYYTEAIKLCPENANYYGNRAACYLMQGQFTKALEDANKSVSIDPKFVKGWLRIAKCTMAQGDLTTAEAALNKAKELEPSGAVLQAELNNFNDLRTYIDNSEKAYNSGDYRMVVYCMDRALNMATSCSRYKVLKAECLAHLGNYQDAQELANEVLAFDKQNADAILVRGMCLYYQDNVDMAFTHFQHVLKLAPDHRRALDIYKKAKALKQKKEEGNEAYKAERYQDAYRLYSEALTIDPKNFANNAKIYFNRALVLSKLKKVEESVADCSEALKLNPSYLKALLKRAEIHTELAQYEEAVQDYEKAAKMDRSRETMKLLNEAKLALKKSQRKDYYKILGVAKNASTEEIKRAYKKRALVHHPDRHANASEGEKKEQEKKFKEVGEAYGVLSNPQKRAKYDNGQSLEDFGGFSEGPEAYAFHTFFDAQFFAQGYPGAFSYQCS